MRFSLDLCFFHRFLAVLNPTDPPATRWCSEPPDPITSTGRQRVPFFSTQFRRVNSGLGTNPTHGQPYHQSPTPTTMVTLHHHHELDPQRKSMVITVPTMANLHKSKPITPIYCTMTHHTPNPLRPKPTTHHPATTKFDSKPQSSDPQSMTITPQPTTAYNRWTTTIGRPQSSNRGREKKEVKEERERHNWEKETLGLNKKTVFFLTIQLQWAVINNNSL